MVGYMKFSKLSVIIPAYYKREFDLKSFTDEISACAIKNAQVFEIVIVCSPETQPLYEQAKGLALNREWIKLVTHDPKIGAEYAYLIEGFKNTAGEFVLYIDPFSKLELNNLAVFKDYMFNEKADIVIGSKSHLFSKVKYSLFRKLVSRIYYDFIKKFIGLSITDAQTGFKLYKAGVLKDVLPRLVTKKYSFDLEVLACAGHLGYKIVEAPVEIKGDFIFEPITPPHIYHIFIDTLAVFYRLKFLKFYDRRKPLSDKLPRVSILIAVKEYSENLKECLESCRRLNYPDFEVIVLPDEKIKMNIEGVKEIPTGCVSPPEKRDLGLKNAAGEIIAFLDDDAFPVEDWLRNAVRYFGSPDIAAVGGPAVTPDNSSLRELASGAVYASCLVAWKNNYRYIPKVPLEIDDYPTCNLFVRGDILRQIGGFDTKFWPGEDTLLCYKITKKLGKKIYYDPDVLVYHKRRPLFKAHWRQIANYALHRGYFVKKYPETSFRISYFFPSFFLLAVMLGWLPGVFMPCLKGFYWSVISIYLFFVLCAGIITANPKLAVFVMAGIISTHLVYGWFFITGLFSKKLKEEK